MAELHTDLIKSEALRIGFDLVGVTNSEPPENSEKLDEWIANGYAGSMSYLNRNADVRKDIRTRFPWVRSVVCVAAFYQKEKPTTGIAANIARYAQGEDYHEHMMTPLKELEEYICKTADGDVQTHRYIDTGPVMERQFAARAGIGWIGKHGLVLNENHGSYFFLGEIITSLDLEYDSPVTDRCGTCTKCLDACPTDAFPQPYVLDATKCISYLTIEHKDSVPDEYKDVLANNMFGCDICQEVCPWQTKRADSKLSGFKNAFEPREDYIQTTLGDLIKMSEEEYISVFKNSPIKRAGLNKIKSTAEMINT